ncbi:hypothetical protein [Bacillus sp. MRMR6]|uniref:hypothetical protein n=1 Tax=Bacillus sp. MRMR6 TaxID=1928617 RepID=UPI00158F42DF|nr:hypothetical protein [Bacillus sp. MRMR6]
MNKNIMVEDTHLEELIKKSKEVKCELDQTPFEDEKKFGSLLKRLLLVHEAMNKLCH